MHERLLSPDGAGLGPRRSGEAVEGLLLLLLLLFLLPFPLPFPFKYCGNEGVVGDLEVCFGGAQDPILGNDMPIPGLLGLRAPLE
jgi:hypothetical protein